MIWLRRISRTLIALALFGMIGVAAAGFFSLRSDVAMLQRLSMERIEWKTAQLETEFARLCNILGRYLAGDDEAGPRAVSDGAGILALRLGLYLNGTVGERIASYDRDGVIAEARRLVALHGTTLRRAGGPTLEDIVAAERDFAAFAEPLRDLSRMVVWGEELRFHEIRADLRRGTEITLTLCLSAMVLAAALVGALMAEVQRHRRNSRLNRDLADRANAASRAKSRFLTMMSHELRTPMNGVLGLMALVRQAGLTEAQERLLETADRSGQQMMTQLSDILDFAALDSDGLALDRSPFSLGRLAALLRDQFEPVARRDGIRFEVRCDGDADVRVMSDLSRVGQIARHMMAFLLDRVAVHEISVAIGHLDGMLTMTLDADEPAVGAPGWRFDAALSDNGDTWGAIESDMFGPTIARTLIGRFEGRLDLTRPRPGQARFTVSIPAEEVPACSPLVRLEVNSDTMRSVCNSFLLRLGAGEWKMSASHEKVDVIVLEAAGEGLPARVRSLRSAHPDARIVALGSGGPDIQCDVRLAYPPSLGQFRDAISTFPTLFQRKVAEGR